MEEKYVIVLLGMKGRGGAMIRRRRRRRGGGDRTGQGKEGREGETGTSRHLNSQTRAGVTEEWEESYSSTEGKRSLDF